MNYITIIAGLACIVFGVASIVSRARSPRPSRKLSAMMDFYGEKQGYVIHVLFYSGVPFIAGIAFIVAGLMGYSLF